MESEEEKLIGKDQLKTSGGLQGSSVGKAQHQQEGLTSLPFSQKGSRGSASL